MLNTWNEQNHTVSYSHLACLFCEYFHLDFVRIHVIYRANQAECGIHILVVAPRESVNVYSTRR